MDSNFEFDYDLRDYPNLNVSSEADPKPAFTEHDRQWLKSMSEIFPETPY